MRALVKTAVGPGNVELLERPVPVPGDDEVLIAVHHVGVCGSDIHIYHDTHPNHPPVTLGHEFSGLIAEVGSAVNDWHAGDRVVSELHGGACGRCRLCKTGNMFACPYKRPIGWWTNGAYADYIVVPAHLLHKVPDSLSLVHAALTEPLAVVMNVLQRTPVTPESRVAVVGPGPIGVLAALAAKAAGASEVILVGRRSSQNRLEFARELGVDEVVASDTVDNLGDHIRDLTGGLGADLTIEAGGSEAAVQAALACTRKLGTIAALGVHSGYFQFPWNEAVFKALNITFSFSANYLAFEQALSLLASGRTPVQRLIQARYPLEEWKTAMTKLEQRSIMKVVLDVVEPAA